MVLWLSLGQHLPANAETTTLEKCTKAVDALEQESKMCDLALDYTKQKFLEQSQMTQSLLEERGAWYKNPVLMLTLGALAGLAAGAVVVGIAK